MKKIILLLLVSSFINVNAKNIDFHNVSGALKCSNAAVWGFYGHQKINRLAVFTLPKEIFTFYKKHIEFITAHAVDPDKRRYATEGEAARHYIDIDHYVAHGEDPFSVVPKKWDDAITKFTEDTLQAYGIVPWHINVMINRLTKAFKEKDLDYILRNSAEIGHYIGDASVPLHTTENYNGQLTDQKGIHGFWESRVVELFSDDYDFFVGSASYIDYPLDYIWDRVKESHYAVDSVLSFERKLNGEFPSDQKYSYDNRGNMTIKTYSREYSKAYQDMLDGMIERRMQSSVISVGSFWYTAWVNAGKPDLSEFADKDISEKLKKELEEEAKDFEKGGKIKGREHQH